MHCGNQHKATKRQSMLVHGGNLMNQQLDRSPLGLEVSNFGPIVEARVDLRPLTVLVGPSNTGKSYLAILIYALHRYFGGGAAGPVHHRIPARFAMFRGQRDQELPGKAIDWTVELAGRLLDDEEKQSSEAGIILPEWVVEHIRSGLTEQGVYIGNEIGRCFGVKTIGALIRKETKGKSAAVIGFRVHGKNGQEPVDHRLTITPHTSQLETIIAEGTQMRIPIEDAAVRGRYLRNMALRMISTGDRGEEGIEFYAREFLQELAGYIHPQIVGPLHLPSFYLPADRTGVMHAYSVVVSALIESAAMTGLRPAARTPMLSGVLADFLEQLIDLDRSMLRKRQRRQDLGKPIEEAILAGSVEIDRSEAIDYPHFTYRPKGWKDNLPLMSASSMVSELAPVVLYLRHMVGPGNVLTVEEPESHLHPAMQVEFTRQLAHLVNAGIRVIVTTHSEWVLEELANIVRRSEISKARRREAVGQRVALHPDQVGAWLFQQKQRPQGSVVKELKLDDETGLYPADYDVVSEALYNDSASIFNETRIDIG